VHAVDPDRRIVIQHDPIEEPEEIVRLLCGEWGFPDVEIVGGLDPWSACEGAKAVVAFASARVHGAVQIGVPVVVYHPSQGDAMFERFPGFPVVRTCDALQSLLAGGCRGADYAAARTYARSDIQAGVRAAAVLRRILHGRRPARLAVAAVGTEGVPSA
jgi:hypothetical protein